MDVNKTDAISWPTDGAGRRNDGGRAPGGQHKDEAEHGWSDDDAVDVHGLPTDDLPPEAQRLIDALAAQIEPMRLQLEQAEARELHWRELARTDSALEIPNRREFFRELQHVVDHLDSLSPAAAVAVLHLPDVHRLRAKLGRGAADAAMGHAAALIGHVIHPTDTLGALGGYDLGIILLNGDGEHVALRLESIRRRLANNPLQLGGDSLPLGLKSGAAILRRGETAEQAIAEADRNLLAG